MFITKDQIIEAIAAMSVMDVVELITAMENKFGVSATNVKPEAIVSTETAEVIEEKTEFDVILESAGTNKIAIIKAVRGVTNLGLKEAKELVDSVPSTLKESISKDEAESLRKSLEEIGAKVKIK